jgi:hypothetical protein
MGSLSLSILSATPPGTGFDRRPTRAFRSRRNTHATSEIDEVIDVPLEDELPRRSSLSSTNLTGLTNTLDQLIEKLFLHPIILLARLESSPVIPSPPESPEGP